MPVWNEPDDNKVILEELELDSTKDLPAMLVFCKTVEDEIAQLRVDLDDSTQETAYQSVKEVIEVLATSVVGTRLENRNCAEGMFSAVSFAVAKYRDVKHIKHGLNFYVWLKELLP